MNRYLRLATDEDVDLLYEWVNDPVTRKSSFSSNEITYEEHCSWYKNLLKSKDVVQYIYEVDGVSIGQLRIVIKGEAAELGYSVAPNYRLMGHGKVMIRLAVEKIKENYSNLKTIRALVKPNNVGSQKMLLENGFKKVCDDYELKTTDNFEISVEKTRNLGGGVLYLTNNSNALTLYDWIAERTDANIYSDRIDLIAVKNLHPRLIVSYNYNFIISEEIISFMHEKIINLHTSYLPWNRGSSPNIWSFLDETPKGCSIHQMSNELDKGKLLYQKELDFDIEKETLVSSYNKLQMAITELFKEHWDEISAGTYKTYDQIGEGSYHSSKDLENLQKVMPFTWNDKVCDVMQRYRKIKNENSNH